MTQDIMQQEEHHRQLGDASDVECAAGTILQKIGCILSYGGSRRDIIINYLLLAFNLYFCIKMVRLQISASSSSLSSSSMAVQPSTFLKSTTAAFAFVIIFQVSLCLIVQCSGISIIWCAMAGWMMSQRRQISESIQMDVTQDGVGTQDGMDTQNSTDCNSDNNDTETTRRALSKIPLAITTNFAAIVYYAVVAAPITTVAHICALVLGAVLSKMALRRSLALVEEEDYEQDVGITHTDDLTSPLIVAQQRIPTPTNVQQLLSSNE
eukprot:CAMPEP_0198130624 /NCGR_PEP_ID=MMETSP1442-20131203/54385_1 /TAXON_ID= /ORGANISM="Craspedostauros australis, Strain CCMP3328" /LENGTH=265 /DNA_ID=CAMNT_0043791289 /DNA_START=217 /DNA_END=1014 /DNA_ORIENTATION=-